MVVMATVEIDPSTIEEINEIVQDLSTGCSLNNGESRLDLPAESHLWALDDGGAEAPFAIDEPDNPSNVLESFLLIFRRGALYATHHRIVTAHSSSIPNGCDKKERVPNGCTGFSSIWPAALTTVTGGRGSPPLPLGGFLYLRHSCYSQP